MKDTPNDKQMCEFSPEESDTHVMLLFFLGGGLFRAAPASYGGSQGMSQIEAVAAGLRHSHSNAGSELHL